MKIDKLIELLNDKGMRVPFYRVFLSAMSDTEALLLSFAVGRSKSNDDWVLFPAGDVESVLQMNYRKQAYVIPQLIERGLLECETRGTPRRRHIRINCDKVAGLLDGAVPGQAAAKEPKSSARKTPVAAPPMKSQKSSAAVAVVDDSDPPIKKPAVYVELSNWKRSCYVCKEESLVQSARYPTDGHSKQPLCRDCRIKHKRFCLSDPEFVRVAK